MRSFWWTWGPRSTCCRITRSLAARNEVTWRVADAVARGARRTVVGGAQAGVLPSGDIGERNVFERGAPHFEVSARPTISPGSIKSLYGAAHHSLAQGKSFQHRQLIT